MLLDSYDSRSSNEDIGLPFSGEEDSISDRYLSHILDNEVMKEPYR